MFTSVIVMPSTDIEQIIVRNNPDIIYVPDHGMYFH